MGEVSWPSSNERRRGTTLKSNVRTPRDGQEWKEPFHFRTAESSAHQINEIDSHLTAIMITLSMFYNIKYFSTVQSRVSERFMLNDLQSVKILHYLTRHASLASVDDLLNIFVRLKPPLNSFIPC